MALGLGFTNTVAVTGVPAHPLAVGVMVNVTVTGAVVVFVSAPLILPLPLAAMPVAVLGQHNARGESRSHRESSTLRLGSVGTRRKNSRSRV